MVFPPAVITVGYELPTYTTSEGRGSLELSITVFNFPTGAPKPFNLSVNTEDGSAGMKYSYYNRYFCVLSLNMQLPLVIMEL